jgi:hypothetical protein
MSGKDNEYETPVTLSPQIRSEKLSNLTRVQQDIIIKDINIDDS